MATLDEQAAPCCRAVEAFLDSAVDPVSTEEAVVRYKRLSDRLLRLYPCEPQKFRDWSPSRDTDMELIGDSAIMARLTAEIELVAPSDLPILITGETGSGKELIARSIHAKSTRAGRPLIYVNCAALPETVAESELFGHIKGAFTGASEHRIGKFESADGGTLFLDEIGELPLSIQPKLLRAAATGEIQRVGSDRNFHVNTRIVAATNRQLDDAVTEGGFRADLFHRINGYEIHAPALREHPEDIPLIAARLLERTAKQLNRGPILLSMNAKEALLHHSWPGNVRELEHLLTRAALRASADGVESPILIDVHHLDPQQKAAPNTVFHPGSRLDPCATVDCDVSFKSAITAFKRRLITNAVNDANGNWALAARRLKLHRSNLYRTAKRLGLKAPETE